MPKVSWLNDDNVPQLDERAERLEHFTTSMADGIIDKEELQKQEENRQEKVDSRIRMLADEIDNALDSSLG